MKCPNCGHAIGCSCSGGSSLTTASDGKQVCTACQSKYEKLLKLKTQVKLNKTSES